MSSAVDDSWSMIEEAVLRLFEELNIEPDTDGHCAVGPVLAEMGWAEIESEYPIESTELLFLAQGRYLTHTDCLDRVMLAELGALLDEPVDALVLPGPAGLVPASQRDTVTGIVLGPLRGRLAVPVLNPTGAVSIGVVDADRLSGEALDTFDSSARWTRVHGPLNATLVDASDEWNRAVAAGQRALATELVAVAEHALRTAIGHAQVRVQFGSPIGAFQSPRHLLADAWACVQGARALLAESWRLGGLLSAQAAKAAAGRAHRTAADAALQVCGAIGLTAEHALHRYVTHGIQIDALLGSSRHLEALLAEQLLDGHGNPQALPAVIACG